ncbi:MAG: hypothetical protein EPO68_00860, partial [Planctomycetota bacterium]
MNDRLAGPSHSAHPLRANSHVRAARIAVAAALACSALAAQEREPKQPATPGGVIGTPPGGLLQKLVAPDGVAGDMFGAAVASSRSIVVAGAPNHPANPPSNADYFAGAAYVFVRESGGTWEPAAKLVAPAGDANPFDAYGSAVSIDGSLLAIGAPQDDGSVPRSNRGAVYVYASALGEWNLEMKLTPPTSDPAQTFGQAVALVGDTLAIGA